MIVGVKRAIRSNFNVAANTDGSHIRIDLASWLDMRTGSSEGDAGSPGSTVAKVNERIFGLTLEDLERTVQRAEENGKPGVIVIASSKKKARVIRALINRPKKVISELIVSGDLAEELAPPKKVRKKSKQTLA